jgi:hypothetical protein
MLAFATAFALATPETAIPAFPPKAYVRTV